MKKLYVLFLMVVIFLMGCEGDAPLSSLIKTAVTSTTTYTSVTVKSVRYDETTNKKSIFRGDTAADVLENIYFTIDDDGTEKTISASQVTDFSASDITVDTSVAKVDATVSFPYNGTTYNTLKVDICTPADKFTISNGELTSFLDDSTANPLVSDKYTKAVVVPKYIDGVEITKISRDWTDTRSKITELYLPDSIETIGDSSFAWGMSITNLVLPNSLKTIETSAFAGSNIPTFSMPNSIETIGTNAFQYLTITVTIVNNSGSNDTLKSLISISTPSDCTVTYVE